MATRDFRDHVDNESNIVWPLPRQPMAILQCAGRHGCFCGSRGFWSFSSVPQTTDHN